MNAVLFVVIGLIAVIVLHIPICVIGFWIYDRYGAPGVKLARAARKAEIKKMGY